MNSFEPWSQGIDMTFTDLDPDDSAAKAYHLCPYSTEFIREALSVKSMNERIRMIDSLILKGLGV
jgi:hypothetical protein